MLRKLFPNVARMWDSMDSGERMVTPAIFILGFALGVALIDMALDALSMAGSE